MVTPLPSVAIADVVTATIENGQTLGINSTDGTVVVPSAATVSGGGASFSISTFGVVTFSTATAVFLSDTFLATYNDYQIIVDCTTSVATTIFANLRTSGGATDSTFNYDGIANTTTGTTNTASSGFGQSSWSFQAVSTGTVHRLNFTLQSPFLATATTGMGLFSSFNNPMVATDGIATKVIQHRALSSFAGFKLGCASGTFSGTVTVIGINAG